MSGKEGSTGYSFFSGIEYEGRSLDFALFGEKVESEAEYGDLFPGEGERGGEELDVDTDTRSLQSPIVLVIRRLSRHDLTG